MAVDTKDILPPRYRGPQRIGRGGMGEIYRATDGTLGRAVAVKVLSERYAEDSAVRERFTREALAAARLSGERNIVTIFDVGEWNDRPFIVMEYLSGGSLEERLRSGAQPPQQACEWLMDAARALDAAHGHGVVHRDVKPANLLLDRDDNVHVADFGIASAAGLDSLTMTGTVLGTAGYLSPEQAQGERATAASDRYALAIVAFELLTGTRPFASDSMTAEAAAHVHADVPSVCTRLSSLPCELDPVFRRALAKEPEARYPTCADFVEDLRQALHDAAGMTREFEPVPVHASAPAAATPTPVEPLYAPVRPRSAFPLVPALVALALLAAGILAAVLLTRGGGNDKPAKPLAAKTLVRTMTVLKTARGKTVTQPVVTTVTVPAPAATQPESQQPATPPPSGGTNVAQGIRDTDSSTGMIRAGDYAGALPLAQKALSELKGTGQIYEAYANYNVGTSLIHLGRCSEGLPYLDASEAIQGHRGEIQRDRAQCK